MSLLKPARFLLLIGSHISFPFVDWSASTHSFHARSSMPHFFLLLPLPAPLGLSSTVGSSHERYSRPCDAIIKSTLNTYKTIQRPTSNFSLQCMHWIKDCMAGNFSTAQMDSSKFNCLPPNKHPAKLYIRYVKDQSSLYLWANSRSVVHVDHGNHHLIPFDLHFGFHFCSLDLQVELFIVARIFSLFTKYFQDFRISNTSSNLNISIKGRRNIN